MIDYLDFSGKRAVVTGGRRGLGKAITVALAERGASVAVIARSQDGEDILQEMERAGTSGCYLQCDLSRRESRCGLIGRAMEHLSGPIDILVNNAGFLFKENRETCSFENWDASQSVLLEAPFDLCRQAAPIMKRQRSGKIINIASVNAVRASQTEFSYGVMKGALMTMTRILSNTLAPFNINVNAIAPGICRSDLTVDHGIFDRERYWKVADNYPLRRLGEAEDIAAIVLFLASEMSRNVSGHTLFADGGFCG